MDTSPSDTLPSYFDFLNNHATPTTINQRPEVPLLSHQLATSQFGLPTTVSYLQPWTIPPAQCYYSSMSYSVPFTTAKYNAYQSPFSGIPTALPANDNEASSFAHTWNASFQRPCSVDSTVSSLSSSSVSIQAPETEATFLTGSKDADANASPFQHFQKPAKKRKHAETVETKQDDTKFTYKRYPKPPYSYVGILVTVIENSPEKRLVLADIHTRLGELFPFFRGAYNGWKDSIRHNLSANRCFYKEPIPSEKPRGRGRHFYWRVDMNVVFPDVFKRQETEVARTGDWAPFLHEQLGTPEIVLPWQSSFSMQICRVVQKNLKRKHTHSPLSPNTVEPTSENCRYPTKTPDARNQFVSMNLPAVSSSAVSFHSPEVQRGRELNTSLDLSKQCADISPVKSYTEGQEPPLRPLDLSSSGYTSSFTDLPKITPLIEYIRSLNQPETSPMAAAENLSDLCGLDGEQPSETPPESFRQTVVWSPISSCQDNTQSEQTGSDQPEVGTDCHLFPEPKAEPRRNSKDFSISSLIEEYIDVE